jgi:simple sugar transport system ATP-binding protein
VRRTLLKQRDEGAAILLISEDLDELFGMSDAIAVFFAGEIMGIVAPEEVSREEVGLMMAGQRRQPAELSGNGRGSVKGE